MSKPIAIVFAFHSESNPDNLYQTLVYDDNTTSCDCPGWRFRRRGGDRQCKHTRLVDMGLADGRCASRKDYRQPVKQPTKRAQAFAYTAPEPGRRLDLSE